MKKLTVIAVMFTAVLFSSCSMTTPLTATSNPIGKKIGTAKATMVFGLCFNGDASIYTAAKNGGITKISTVDVKRKNTLGFIMAVETIVTGE